MARTYEGGIAILGGCVVVLTANVGTSGVTQTVLSGIGWLMIFLGFAWIANHKRERARRRNSLRLGEAEVESFAGLHRALWRVPVANTDDKTEIHVRLSKVRTLTGFSPGLLHRRGDNPSDGRTYATTHRLGRDDSMLFDVLSVSNPQKTPSQTNADWRAAIIEATTSAHTTVQTILLPSPDEMEQAPASIFAGHLYLMHEIEYDHAAKPIDLDGEYVFTVSVSGDYASDTRDYRVVARGGELTMALLPHRRWFGKL